MLIMLTVADRNYSVHQLVHQFLQNLPIAAAGVLHPFGVLVGHPQSVNVARCGRRMKEFIKLNLVNYPAVRQSYPEPAET